MYIYRVTFPQHKKLNETLDNKTEIVSSSRDFPIDKLQVNQNNTSVSGLKVQALMSTSNKFSIMLNSYQFGIMGVDETRPQDTIYQRYYVQSMNITLYSKI